ncbi:unnamed protein product, partial [Iphiclides podalirius]
MTMMMRMVVEKSIYCRREGDSATWRERDRRTRSPWEMHSSGQIRLRARRPSARIIVVASRRFIGAYAMRARRRIATFDPLRRVDFALPSSGACGVPTPRDVGTRRA